MNDMLGGVCRKVFIYKVMFVQTPKLKWWSEPHSHLGAEEGNFRLK